MKDTPEMKKPLGKIAVIGGDLRQLEAAKAFSVKGYECHVYGLDIVGDSRSFDGIIKADSLAEALFSAILVLLPLPYSRDGIHINAPLSTQKIKITSLFPLLCARQKIAAGLLGATLPEGFEAFDYAASESFAIRNARATVEGALAIAIRETPITLNGADILVVGYGRIGKMLATTLKDLGANVTVIARRASDRALAWSQGLGGESYASFLSLAASCDMIFNTVPATVITGEILSALPQDAVIIELASPPGGIDLREAAQHGTHVISALGLPGKFSPKTAGNIITDCVSDAFGL
ncbi:MAG: NAD(P)-binding domain-containing protein [Clostridia bacterium]|nr:NAD(P)-binding domain-containing protein [Clostridia bacterium]